MLGETLISSSLSGRPGLDLKYQSALARFIKA
jgi:hypothetical protein